MKYIAYTDQDLIDKACEDKFGADSPVNIKGFRAGAEWMEHVYYAKFDKVGKVIEQMFRGFLEQAEAGEVVFDVDEATMAIEEVLYTWKTYSDEE